MLPYTAFIPKSGVKAKLLSPGIEEIHWKTPLGKCAADNEVWKETRVADIVEVDKTPIVLEYQKRTKQGVDTIEFMQQVMRRAWGDNPPAIDLYLRAGSGGSYELSW